MKFVLLINLILLTIAMLASVVQLDAHLTGDQEVAGIQPPLDQQHSFVEIDPAIFSTVILSHSLIQEGQLSVSGKRMCTNTG